jgi:hypothetical protein
VQRGRGHFGGADALVEPGRELGGGTPRPARGRDRLVVIEKHESGQVRSQHLKGAALAGLRSALDGTLGSTLDAQVHVSPRAGNVQKGGL